tara:strand:+ start:34 stop:918 length:885 start_codon:yes stop_codon:yes gene_type:complete
MLNFFLYFIAIYFVLFSYPTIAKDTEPIIKYEIGKSYKIKGKWYYPSNNFNYNEIGIASINLQKKDRKTKNGEIFSNKKILAKHKTLALPTIVRVTNLDNGYSINVRINDRGPRNNFRILELSKRTAKYLKIKGKGLVEVKVIENLTLQEQNLLNNKYNDVNLEKDIALGKEVVETENLLDNKELESIKKNYVSKDSKTKKKLKINLKKTKVSPYYLRVNITKFKNFKDAADVKKKLKPIYDKILISLGLLNGQKYYKVTTVPIKTLDEAEKILNIIQKKGFNNAKLFIERKKR